MGVNDYGDLVGFAITTDTGAHGFLWKHQNTITYFNTPEAGPSSDIHTVAMSVNKALVVGGADWFFRMGLMRVATRCWIQSKLRLPARG